METKKDIRKAALEKRKLLPADIRRKYSRTITERVLRHPFFQCADMILCYVSFREEVNTVELIERALELGKTVGIPKVLGKNRMEFYEINSLLCSKKFGTIQNAFNQSGELWNRIQEVLKPGYQGILEPDIEKLRRISFDTLSEKDGNTSGIAEKERKPLMLLPGAAFDTLGNRIGYGGGYYDAYLQRYPYFHKIGLAFSVQCAEKIPAEAHDVCVDAVLTESGDHCIHETKNGEHFQRVMKNRQIGERGLQMQSALPNDPVMLLSVINTKLRDYYPSLDILCQEMEIEKAGLTEKLAVIDYEYDAKRNQFV